MVGTPPWFVYGLTVRITGVFWSSGIPFGRRMSACSVLMPSPAGK
jgi:hypothetical protein